VASFTFWLAGENGSAQYRGVIPAFALHWEEHDVAYGMRVKMEHLDNDVVVASRLAHPMSMDVWRRMKIDYPKTRTFIDIDDDYFNIEKTNAGAWQFWEQGIHPSGEVIKEGGLLGNLRESMQLADGVTVCSDLIAASVARQGIAEKKIKIVENGLHAGIKNKVMKYDPGTLTIGWAGSENTAAWLPMIKDVVNSAAKGALGPVPYVHFVGIHHEEAGKLGFRWNHGGTVEWVKAYEDGFDDYLTEISKIDIWLAPYESTPFTEAKFPTKGLESGFMAKPIIASDIAPYRRWIRHGWNGYLARNKSDWTLYLKHLLNDGDMRMRMGLNNDRRASRNTMQAVAKWWESACLS
jgi:hypothetical protein